MLFFRFSDFFRFSYFVLLCVFRCYNIIKFLIFWGFFRFFRFGNSSF